MRSIQKQVACSLFSCLFHSLRDSSLPRAAPSLQLNQPPFLPPSHPPKSSFLSSVRPSSNSRNRPFSFSSDSELSSSEDERPDTFKWNPFADTKRNRKERPTLESRTQSRSARNRSAAAARADYDATADTTDPSHRWSRIQVGKGKLLGKKPKKRPPPGPRQFEDLTAKTPMHSDLPFDFRFSYTETYKATPVRFQEPFSPFGPGRLDREWTGLAAVRTPVSASVNPDASAQDSQQKTSEDKADLKGEEGKTKLSSSHPSARKKGVKPGPSLRGKAPKRAKTREEILGEPLTKEEVKELVEHCNKSDKQVNLGRDGLTHNMLILIHNNWKREHAVRIKCKGVPTVDMDNICFHLEDKTGGKIIHRAGGAVYLFRGHNYTKKDRPEIPLMLWKPHSPIYPKLIQAVPDGLTLNEANAKRKRGLKIMPLCKLAKNGYYADLVKHVKEAFEDDELVRIDCKGLNTSDYKKIGAKLRDRVPCVLLSFEREQIIIWRGREYHESMKPKETGVVEDATSDGHALKEAGLSPEVDGFKNDAEITAVSSSSVVLDEHDQSGGVFNVEEEELLLSDSDCDADALDEGDASSKSWESDFNIDDGEGDSSDESLPDEGEEMSYSLPSDYAGKSDAARASLQ